MEDGLKQLRLLSSHKAWAQVFVEVFGEEHLKQAIRMKNAPPQKEGEGGRGNLPGGDGGGGGVDDDELSHLSNMSEPPTLDWVASSSTVGTVGSRGNR